MKEADLVLVSMPFAPFWIPNAGMAVLAGAARAAGLSVIATYPDIRLGRRIGLPVYFFISEQDLANQMLLGEWLFSGLIAEHPSRATEECEVRYEKELIDRLSLFMTDKTAVLQCSLHELRRTCAGFLDLEVERVAAMNPRIVGCSSTFAQHAASIAFLRNIKEMRNDVVTMIGGANCEADMGFETALRFPWIDYVFSGEADETFPSLCQRILNKGRTIPVSELPHGVYSLEKAADPRNSPNGQGDYEVSFVRDMDRVCMPDYDDYFEELEETGMVGRAHRACAVESSRGCQKGEKLLCTFCGLNGARVSYRSKSKEKFLGEVRTLKERYDAHVFLLTDNILGRHAFGGWLRDAAAEGTSAYFVELRSILGEQQVRMLADAEVFNAQPGIESLNDHLLRLMQKANSALSNIAFMKYAMEQGIIIAWNMLHGIPGEAEEDYREIAELIPLVHHLQPPRGCSPISFCKFSRYHRAPENYHIDLVPLPAYRAVYPGLSDEALGHLAYHFVDRNEAEGRGTPGLSAAKQAMFDRVNEWKALYAPRRETGDDRRKRGVPTLLMNEINGLIKIRDSRSCAVSSHHYLDGLDSEIYRNTRHPCSLDGIRFRLSQHPHLKHRVHELEGRLEGLVRKNLLVGMKSRFVALATCPRRPLSETRRRGLEYLRQRGRLIHSSEG